MRLLLDTCIVYDWLMGAITNQDAIRLIQNSGAVVSAVCVWEMAIKNNLGKMPLPSPQIVDDIGAQGFEWLSITPSHTQAVMTLPDHHKDPFDRLLIAQAHCEEMRIVTYDRLFQDYRPNTYLA
ncbi:PIN domain nuclease [Lamprobacter modestohalophilus]|uniref:PIN domain nuclease n=1 Tax=Lamprobacter modestohalophilus TaxID=1064514 RepID=A0A9X1B654_9GAMM|nr:PIN domain nuclease [Lamprobacter modestohalophilus]MCF8005066.1 type II toxin-antitoxin system VapC family toxin [Chromatiaceae bacterium]